MNTLPVSPVSSSAPSLSPLKTVQVVPEQPSSRTATESPTLLLNIERIEIAKAECQDDALGKHQRYVLSIYCSKQDKTKPEFQVVHTVSQFCSLRNAVHACIQSGHCGSRCAFCSSLVRFVTYGDGRAFPFAALAYNPSGDAWAILTAFMNQTLEQSQHALESLHRSSCRGQHQLPRLLHAFIFRSPRP